MTKMHFEEIYPFDFIPIKDQFTYKSFSDRGALFGTIQVKLTVKTPLIAIKSKNDENNMQTVPLRSHKIPASSIRGMLRNAAEIIWNGKITTLHNKNKSPLIEQQWKMDGSTIYKHCPVSHLFGFVDPSPRASGDQKEVENKHLEEALGSSIRFSDGIVVRDTANGSSGYIKKNTLFTSTILYKDKESSRLAGRKVYLAGRLNGLSGKLVVPETVRETFDNFTMYFKKGKLSPDPIKEPWEYFIFPGTQYKLQLHFEKLTNQDLADLIRLIELKDEFVHALGKGKPLGLGRVKLEIEGIHLRDKNFLLDFFAQETFDKGLKYKLLQETENRYENEYEQYFERLQESVFNDKKRFRSKRSQNKSPKRYSELKKLVKGDQPQTSCANNPASKPAYKQPDKLQRSNKGQRSNRDSYAKDKFLNNPLADQLKKSGWFTEEIK